MGRRCVLLGLIGLWLAWQVLFPLRHLLYPGSPSWTEEGHRFAWQMKLRDKKAELIYTVRDPATGEEWDEWPEDYLARHQLGMATRPEMVVQFAHHLAELLQDEYGIEEVEVRARACVSLNGRPAALMIDPTRDLTKIEPSLRPADWILPLEQPFERPPMRARRYDLDC